MQNHISKKNEMKTTIKHIVLILSLILFTTTGGFAQSPNETLTLEVKGMSCQIGCADGIDAKFSTINGIVSSETSFDQSTSRITYNPEIITKKEIIKVVTNKGFTASVKKDDTPKTTHRKNCTGACCKKE